MGIINLQNADTWTTREGHTCLISELEERHARNILRYLERNAPHFELMYSLGVLESMPAEMGDMAEMMVESELNESAIDPVGWIRQTPAYQAVARHLQAMAS